MGLTVVTTNPASKDPKTHIKNSGEFGNKTATVSPFSSFKIFLRALLRFLAFVRSCSKV